MTPSPDQTSPWEDADLPPACLEWAKAVDRIMWRDWYLTSSGAGWDQDQLLRYWGYGDTPEAFVEWFAEKYDLIRFD